MLKRTKQYDAKNVKNIYAIDLAVRVEVKVYMHEETIG